MENGKQPIYPDPMRGAEQSFTNQSPHDLSMGLTKREYFAGLAMQGLVDRHINYEVVAEYAVEYADALLKELDRPKSEIR